MIEITSLNNLKQQLEANDKLFMLLFKKGSEQSDCAFSNFEEAASETAKFVCFADVLKVRDIHPEFKITSAPSLLHFENGTLKNVVKGCQQVKQIKAMINGETVAARTEEKNAPQKNVVVYTTPTCSWCTTLKRHLDVYGIRYREVNVAADEKAAASMIQKSGQQGVPQTEINGQMIVGFDKARINTLLGIN